MSERAHSQRPASDFLARAQLVHLRVERLRDEANRSSDPDRIRAIGDEMELLIEGLRDIREEQLMEQIAVEPERKRRWWTFWWVAP